jgi:CelD/BcsL family acetyltransferase involved in cellulose biosynthesis/peptidoglycan/xylan/chitin deacetylase (PgdA/CDA1 family)
MKLVELRHATDLENLKPGWSALLEESVAHSIFVTPEWLTAWWSAYGNGREIRILAAYDDGGVLRGLGPLMAGAARRYGQTVSTLSFLGDGSNDSDYLDFIAASGWEERVAALFHGYFEEELKRGRVLLLNEIPESSHTLPFLRTLAESPGCASSERDVPCASVKLPGTWDEYLVLLKPRFRSKVRSVLRSLEGRPEVRFGFCETAEQVEQLLPVLFDLHRKRWAQEGKPGVFGWKEKREFYVQLSARLLERGWLRFSWLEWNGTVLACQYGFEYRGVYSQLQEGYEPASEHWNLGVGLRAWSIREFIKRGLSEYDFLAGTGRHKSDWGTETKNSKQIELAQASYRNILFRRGREWESSVRESLKKTAPGKRLVARRAQRSPVPVNGAVQTVAESPAKVWMRQALANCYFHLQAPKLVQRLRSQYQVSVSTNGSSRLAWKKREEPSARILYFHRVNDDRDPFFPAISTALFEQEMKHLARHYRVVSLGRMLEHLEDGSREPLLAITFDDGYQDNYQNAFPVLQCYGLPATIFLTTGSIDSRDPLWFEQLAEALKKTTREHLDLEIDIPRRFWMRTQPERLETNRRILDLLRRLPDGERRQSVDQILKELAVSIEDRRSKMLTWDQVRLMKAQGIDFGGHTVTHPFISRLTAEQVAWEVTECKRRIEQELQIPVDCFAYPNGREEDFGKWNKAAIQQAGYRAAVTTIWGPNYRSTDRLELRRGGPWEESPAMFAYKMDWYELAGE